MAVSKVKEKETIKEMTHRGPLKAWNERFQNYLKTKEASHTADETLFQPQINSHSKKIAHSIVGKVENRLLCYGEQLKEKKAEL